MIQMVICRVYVSSGRTTRLEFALGRTGEYPRVIFRGIGPAFPRTDEATVVRSLMEWLAEELFSYAAYAERELQELPYGPSQGGSESSWQLLLSDTLDGGGRGGPAGGDEPGEA